MEVMLATYFDSLMYHWACQPASLGGIEMHVSSHILNIDVPAREEWQKFIHVPIRATFLNKDRDLK